MPPKPRPSANISRVTGSTDIFSFDKDTRTLRGKVKDFQEFVDFKETNKGIPEVFWLTSPKTGIAKSFQIIFQTLDCLYYIEKLEDPFIDKFRVILDLA